jgi:outer membrane protein OmpA-like peptidoglycan-associated protein
VKDEGGASVSGAKIMLTTEGDMKTTTSDASGGFSFKDLRPATVTLKAEASGYMNHVQQQEVRANEDTRATLTMNKKPKTASVKIEGKEIKISKQIHFDTDSAKILGDSNSLMEEIADVLQHNPSVQRVEIQGHTDNTGTKEHNVQLSDDRANAVRTWLVNAGVESSRLSAKGYGPDRPLAPNVTASNRAKNRRVQFIIQEK